jgi:hypothetical protein
MAVNDIREGFGSETLPGPSGPFPPARLPWQRRAWLAFSRWRRRRPFWSGLLIALAGIEILATVWAPLPVILHVGLQGLAGYLVPIVILLCGVLLWFSPEQRVFYSVLSVLLSLVSWVTSNLGGFFIGILLGLVGGSLAFAWSPDGYRKRKQ